MATEFLMPKLGLTMEEGTITEWLVADGDEVASGAAVLRIETDKTETDVEAAGSGRLHMTGQVGDTFACGERIGWFLEAGEDAPETAAPAAAAPAVPAVSATPAAPAQPVAAVAATLPGGRLIASPNVKRLAAERGIDLRTVHGTGPGGRIVSEDLEGVVAVPSGPGTNATTPPPGAAALTGPSGPATFAARSLADLLGLDIAAIPADPVDGRVTRDAVAAHVRALLAVPVPPALPAPIAATAAPAPAPARSPAALPLAMQTPSAVVPLTGMRGTIAKRMHASLAEMAQLTLHMDADLDEVIADRNARKAGGRAPSYTDYVIAAAARALVEHPNVNAQVTDDGIALLPEVHVGMAVALDDGLIVPVIKDTAGRDLASLGAESSRLAAAARDGSLAFADLEGGTFSVSTLGAFGVDGFTPVINPPNAAILGVGRLRNDVVADDDGNVGTVSRMTLSLTWDHRVFDGAPAAAFCRRIVELLGDPASLDSPLS